MVNALNSQSQLTGLRTPSRFSTQYTYRKLWFSLSVGSERAEEWACSAVGSMGGWLPGWS